VSDEFNPQCPNCQVTIGRIQKWIDHIGCSPRKFKRYDRLLEFVKMIAKEELAYGSDLQNKETLHWISTASKNLIKDIGENE
jgi:hypothetical protein